MGKESDIYITASDSGRQLVLKLHRLGRISFRSVKANRDYLRHRNAGSWMHLSRLAAQKEYAFMRVLWREGFPVPEPVAWSRHTVVMEFVDAFPLRMIEHVPEPGKLYAELMHIIVRLARRGMIHGDFNEFNILVKEIPTTTKVDGESAIKLEPIVIDFPQTVSTNHANAQMYFDRDVACVKRYFERRLRYVADEPGPFFEDAIKGADPEMRLDVEVEASGFSRKMARELERWVGVEGEAAETEKEGGNGEDEDEDEDETNDDEDDEEEEAPPDDHDVHDDPNLEEQFDRLQVTEPDLSVKPLSAADYGLMPLDLQQEPDVVAEKVRTKKKATGWAI